MREFCAQNFLVLQPSALPAEFHSEVFDQLEAIHAAGGGIPSNSAIIEAVPALQHVYDDPTIRGAVQSLVGPGAVMHFHRHCHRREAEPGGRAGGGQNWCVLHTNHTPVQIVVVLDLFVLSLQP